MHFKAQGTLKSVPPHQTSNNWWLEESKDADKLPSIVTP